MNTKEIKKFCNSMLRSIKKYPEAEKSHIMKFQAFARGYTVVEIKLNKFEKEDLMGLPSKL